MNNNFFPSVTIVVPCWNEEKTVAGTLKSLLDLDYPKDRLKIIVVDDGSTDKTAEEVKKFLPHPQIKLIQKENGGKHTALNIALKEINTELVAALDADSYVSSKSLKNMVLPFKNYNVASIASTIKIIESKNFWAIIQKIDYFMIAYLRKTFSFLGSIFITPGPFSFYRTSVVKEIGGWKKAHNTEDVEIGIRLQSKHYMVENVENSEVYTHAMLNFKSLYKQRLRWTYGFIKNAWDYRYMFFNKEYGNVGIFGMPSFLIANFVAVLIYLLSWFVLIKQFIEWIKKVNLIGWDNFEFNYEWFYLKTDSFTILGLLLTIAILFSVIIGRNLIENKKSWGFEPPQKSRLPKRTFTFFLWYN